MTEYYDFRFEKGDIIEYELDDRRAFVQTSSDGENEPYYIVSILKNSKLSEVEETDTIGEIKNIKSKAIVIDDYWKKVGEIHNSESEIWLPT